MELNCNGAYQDIPDRLQQLTLGFQKMIGRMYYLLSLILRSLSWVTCDVNLQLSLACHSNAFMHGMYGSNLAFIHRISVFT